MYARIVQLTGATDIDGGVDFVRDTVTPLIRQQHGYRGMVVSADRNAKVLGIMSNWETEADLDASNSAMTKVRQEGQQIIGGTLTVEGFEQTVFVAKQPPTVGTSLLVRRIRQDPSVVEENLEFFRTTVLPMIEASEGFLGARQLINRATGDGVVGTVWTDPAALDAAAETARERQPLGESRGITFGEQTKREILYVDLP
jgi:heme-degrading monooxygenase HmoA